MKERGINKCCSNKLYQEEKYSWWEPSHLLSWKLMWKQLGTARNGIEAYSKLSNESKTFGSVWRSDESSDEINQTLCKCKRGTEKHQIIHMLIETLRGRKEVTGRRIRPWKRKRRHNCHSRSILMKAYSIFNDNIYVSVVVKNEEVTTYID